MSSISFINKHTLYETGNLYLAKKSNLREKTGKGRLLSKIQLVLHIIHGCIPPRSFFFIRTRMNSIHWITSFTRKFFFLYFLSAHFHFMLNLFNIISQVQRLVTKSMQIFAVFTQSKTQQRWTKNTRVWLNIRPLRTKALWLLRFKKLNLSLIVTAASKTVPSMNKLVQIVLNE